VKQSTSRLLLAAATALVVVLVPGAAQAHGEEGSFEVTSAAPAGDLTVAYDVLLTYDDDGDAAAGATVALTGEGPGGATVGPVALAPTGESGHYAATVTFPAAGQWQLRISGTSPEALLEHPQTVEPVAAPTTTAPPTTSAATSAPTTAAPTTAAPSTSAPSTPSTTAPATTVDSSVPALAGAADDGGDGSNWAWIAVIAVVTVVAVGSTLTVMVRRRSAA
jgi:YtkA-like protein